MLNGGREGLFELGQQLQQQGEYQAALHCFLSCLLGLNHVQSFTSLPNCLHQVSEMGTGGTHTPTKSHTHSVFSACFYLSSTHANTNAHTCSTRPQILCSAVYLHSCTDAFLHRFAFLSVINHHTPRHAGHSQRSQCQI